MRAKRKLRVDGVVHEVPISNLSHPATHKHLGLTMRIFPPQNFMQQFINKTNHPRVARWFFLSNRLTKEEIMSEKMRKNYAGGDPCISSEAHVSASFSVFVPYRDQASHRPPIPLKAERLKMECQRRFVAGGTDTCDKWTNQANEKSFPKVRLTNGLFSSQVPMLDYTCCFRSHWSSVG